MSLPIIYSTNIHAQWLDYNNHLNVAYYVLIFDHAGEAILSSLGLGEEVTKKTGISWAVMENHITYDREVVLGQTVDVGMQLLDCDHKRMHLYFEMHVAGHQGYLAATLEQMVMCIDLNTRRSAIFPEKVQANIQSLAHEQADLAPPDKIGRKIGIRR